jgi:short-chain fatty acids transporter
MLIRQLTEPLGLAIVLTLLVLAVATLQLDMPVFAALSAWGRGLSQLNSFAMQVTLLILFSSALAYTHWAQQAISYLAGLPRSANGMYVAVILVAAGTSFLSGAFGLVAGALSACALSVAAARKGIAVHYPLLVAAAYSGFVIWHGGLTGTAPLFVATEGHAMTALTGGVIPLKQTIFSAGNLITTLLVVVVLCIATVLIPSRGKALQPDVNQLTAYVEGELVVAGDSSGGRPLSLFLALLILTWVALQLSHSGNLDFPTLIFACLGFGLALADSPKHYHMLCKRSVATVLPVIVLYPLYGAIMALCSESGLVERMSTALTAWSSPELLPLIAFFSAAAVNLLIPSGGGQWVLQGPVLLDSALSQGVEAETIVMAFAYGDQWTNLVQPFWIIPLLGICGLELAAVFRYLLILFLSSGTVFTLSLLLM